MILCCGIVFFRTKIFINFSLEKAAQLQIQIPPKSRYALKIKTYLSVVFYSQKVS